MGGLAELPNPFDGASQPTGLHRMTGKATSFDYPVFAGDIFIVCFFETAILLSPGDSKKFSALLLRGNDLLLDQLFFLRRVREKEGWEPGSVKF